MLGNTLSSNGSANSANGMMTMMRNGTRRKMSAVVRMSCCRSRRLSVRPCSSAYTSRSEICTSA